VTPLSLAIACVLPPATPSDEAWDSAGSVEREPVAPAGCALTVATICGDCDVTVDWSAQGRFAAPEFVAVWTYDRVTPPPDLVEALCDGADYARPDELDYADEIGGTTVILGEDLPRVTHVAIFQLGVGFDYLQAVLVPDPGSANRRVVIE
jgi:hypothetical protein